MQQPRKYRGIVASDWSECLSPNGPFDPLRFSYPNLSDDLSRIFKQYTGNEITLGDALNRIKKMLPKAYSVEEMDAYLNADFQTYTGVPELIDLCLSNDVLFVLNTTGTQAYFQRAIKKGLLPQVPYICANPFVTFKTDGLRSCFDLIITEISDKPKCSSAIASKYGMSGDKILAIGDSGGDGPHFKWVHENGGFLIASMQKHSLAEFCQSNEVQIDFCFGRSYGRNEPRNLELEMTYDFTNLFPVIQAALKL
jgi:2-hydroxy-3-keto-5-methylthiopentenyl-1-phosphate phosphatase